MPHSAFNSDNSWFKHLFDSSPDPTWIIEDNRFVECNEAAIKTLGYASREEFLNVHPSRLSPPRQLDGEDSFAKAERMMAIAKDKGLHRFEWIHTKADGSNFVAEVTLSNIELKDRSAIYCVWRDITERKQAVEALQQSQVELHEAQRIAHMGSWQMDAATNHVVGSEELHRMFGWPPGLPLPDFGAHNRLYTPESWKRLSTALTRALETGVPYELELEVVKPDGSHGWIQARGEAQRDANNAIVGLRGVALDITERKQAEEALRKQKEFFNLIAKNIGDFIAVLDLQGRRLYNSPLYIQIFGAERDLLGTDSFAEIHPEDQERVKQVFRDTVQTGMGRQIEYRLLRADGSFREMKSFGSVIRDSDGRIIQVAVVSHDISERKTAEEKINELAFHDQLTGLPNRTLLLDRLRQTMTTSSRSDQYGAVLFIDLDKFKTLNDTLGHEMGDLLLKLVAQRLTACVRAGDTVSRLGGDEFVVMLASLSTSERDAATQTEVIGEKIRLALNRIYQINDVEYHITPSIGATLFRGLQTEMDILLKQAELAMYKSKDAGRNTLRFFDPDMEFVVMKRAALENDLRVAVQEQQFLLYYQAQMTSGHLTGVEALARWQHPQRGMVSPVEFIPLAEETGLILLLGQWVLETACTQLAVWATRPEMAHLTIAVNVSVHQFRQRDFVDQVLAVLKNSGANPQRLKLELTESLLVDDVEDIIVKMKALKAKGVGFSLDDFGTGYSSLSYLKRLPLDQLKIDQSFVRDVFSDPNDASIAKTIIALAQSLGLGVIAEGVETATQRDFLASSGCHAYQGFFFSRPLPLDGFEEFAQLDGHMDEQA